MRTTLTDLLLLAGLALLSWGLYLWFGPGPACTVAGGLLMLSAVLLARGVRP